MHGKPEALSDLTLRPALERRSRGEVSEAWEHYWKWVDANPESLRPRSADI